MEAEIHLFIIWEKARYLESEILGDISKHFEILDTYLIRWPHNQFSSNLTRFYGQKLSSSSEKIRTCGRGDFRLIILKDVEPLYRYRNTSKGIMLVNVNLFDAKELYRSWTGGGHKIHATNSIEETNHDLFLLTGLKSDDFFNFNYVKHNVNDIVEKQLVGADGYNNIVELLNLLNNCTNYVILRNYSCIPDSLTLGEHSDLDLLTDSFNNTFITIGGKKEYKNKYRVRVLTYVGGEKLFIDIRYIGDGYYDSKWETNILNHKIYDDKNFYVPEKEDYLHALIYHSLIHKRHISDDYISEFSRICGEENCNRSLLINRLYTFMSEKKYSFTEPEDLSVYFNTEGLDLKESFFRRLRIKINLYVYFLKHPLFFFFSCINYIKKIYKRIKYDKKNCNCI